MDLRNPKNGFEATEKDQSIPTTKMDFDYYELFVPLKWVLQDNNITFVSNNNACPHFKRMKVYFNLLNTAVKQNNKDLFLNTYEKLVENESSCVANKFLSIFLKDFDEDDYLGFIFEQKEEMGDQEYLDKSNFCAHMRKFKNYIRENPPCCCG